jgi:hypothetical protein
LVPHKSSIHHRARAEPARFLTRARVLTACRSGISGRIESRRRYRVFMARIMIPKDRLDAIDAVAIQTLVDAGALESRTPLLHWGSVQPAGIGLRVW